MCIRDSYGIDDKEIRQKCCDSVLTLTDRDCIEESLEKILQNIIPYDKAKTLKFQLKDWKTKLSTQIPKRHIGSI